jgi:predicted ATPase
VEGTLAAVDTATGPRSAARYTAERGLYGRECEFGVLDHLAGRLDKDAGGALVVRGEAGIGKSALLAAIEAQARDRGTRVLSAVGVQSEAQISFAGLHQLLRPVLQLAEDLPTRQRATLHAAFGMSEEVTSELFLTGLATLELIGDAAESSPVLLIIEDAQWLDQPSCEVLAFVARRLAAEPALMLIAVRDGFPNRSTKPG